MNRTLAAGFAVTLALLNPVTSAMARPDTRTMTCAQAQDLVKRSGAIVLTTGDYTYSAFVGTRAYCQSREFLRPSYAPTRDNPSCRVGSRCVEPPPRNN